MEKDILNSGILSLRAELKSGTMVDCHIHWELTKDSETGKQYIKIEPTNWYVKRPQLRWLRFLGLSEDWWNWNRLNQFDEEGRKIT